MSFLRLPVLQLTWAVNKGVFGLLYPSELNYESQDFSFILPVPIGYLNSRPRYDRLENLLNNTEFYFPVEIGGKYMEIPGEVNIKEDLFEPTKNNTISFTTPSDITVDLYIDLFQLKSLYRTGGMKRLMLNKYVGDYKKAIFDECLFVPIIVKDVKILNSLLQNYNSIFVGYTKNFGVFDERDDNHR